MAWSHGITTTLPYLARAGLLTSHGTAQALGAANLRACAQQGQFWRGISGVQVRITRTNPSYPSEDNLSTPSSHGSGHTESELEPQCIYPLCHPLPTLTAADGMIFKYMSDVGRRRGSDLRLGLPQTLQSPTLVADGLVSH